MDYEFGDIFDCRKVPTVDHFIVVIGTNKNEVMYYKIFSRTYTVFKDIVDFFNSCISKKCSTFQHKFSKEKGKEDISLYGKLSHTLFLDRETNYMMCLDVDSMVIVNSEPDLIDKDALDMYVKDRIALYKVPMANIDIYKLIGIIKHSKYIGPAKGIQIRTSFNRKRKTIKNWIN